MVTWATNILQQGALTMPRGGNPKRVKKNCVNSFKIQSSWRVHYWSRPMLLARNTLYRRIRKHVLFAVEDFGEFRGTTGGTTFNVRISWYHRTSFSQITRTVERLLIGARPLECWCLGFAATSCSASWAWATACLKRSSARIAAARLCSICGSSSNLAAEVESIARSD